MSVIGVVGGGTMGDGIAQVFAAKGHDVLLLEVDDVLETSSGDRFYIVSVRKDLHPRAAHLMTLTAWKIADGDISRRIEPLYAAAGEEA